jgi:predicted RNase H-like nuclease
MQPSLVRPNEVAMSLIAGVDGCKDGWVCLSLHLGRRQVEATVLKSLAELNPRLQVIGVDVPIGIPDSNGRDADRLARLKLGEPRRRSVFPAPIRPALSAKSWEEACQITLAIDGHRVTKQTAAILPKIYEADELLRSASPIRRAIYEVHPEVSFAEWNGAPMAHRKKSPNGRADRESLIGAYFGPDAFAQARSSVRGCRVAADDIADAFAALWTAERISNGIANRLPAAQVTDSCGVPMNIWF